MAESTSARAADRYSILFVSLILVFPLGILPLQKSLFVIQGGDTQHQLLEQGKPIEKELAGGQSHLYQITLTRGQYLSLTVDQRGIDVVVALFTPGGEKTLEVSDTAGVAGQEMLSAIAEADGVYRVEVRSAETNAKMGRYEIRVEELKTATAEDKYRVAADALFREADIPTDGTGEERRKSLEKYDEALGLYRKAGDRKDEAETMNNIGYVYESLGEYRKALESYDVALSIKRAIGNRDGGSDTLINIGQVYASMGEHQKALEKYNEALPLARAAGDIRLEGILLNNIGSIYKAMGEMEKAIKSFNESLQRSRETGDRSTEIGPLNNLV